MNDMPKHIDIAGDSSINIVYRMSYLSNHFLLPMYDVFLKELDICRAEYGALFCINFRPGTYARDIASILGLPKNSVSRAINLLIAKGLLESRPDEDDNRRAKLKITNKGQKFFDRLTSNLELRQKKLLQCLTAEEIERLDSILSKLSGEIGTWNLPDIESLDLPSPP